MITDLITNKSVQVFFMREFCKMVTCVRVTPSVLEDCHFYMIFTDTVSFINNIINNYNQLYITIRTHFL